MWAALAVLVADRDGVDVIVVTFRKCNISGSATSTNAHLLSFFQAKSGPHLAAGLWVQAPSQPACPSQPARTSTSLVALASKSSFGRKEALRTGR
jgi:hypothetical protein